MIESPDSYTICRDSSQASWSESAMLADEGRNYLTVDQRQSALDKER